MSRTTHSNHTIIDNVYVAGKPKGSRWDICCSDGSIDIITPHLKQSHNTRLVTPSFCHPHIHLDKCFLLSHPKYADLVVKEGNFSEALSLTSMKAVH